MLLTSLLRATLGTFHRSHTPRTCLYLFCSVYFPTARPWGKDPWQLLCWVVYQDPLPLYNGSTRTLVAQPLLRATYIWHCSVFPSPMWEKSQGPKERREGRGVVADDSCLFMPVIYLPEICAKTKGTSALLMTIDHSLPKKRL